MVQIITESAKVWRNQMKDLLISEIKSFMAIKDILIDEPMKDHTSFKVGGLANILLTPHKEDEIQQLLKLLTREDIPFYIMGNGSNLLVSDGGYNGVVIKISGNYNDYSIKDNIIDAQSGLLLSALAQVALSAGLAGFEFASGIPGTLGGAVTMNAGAYSGEIKDVLKSARVISKEGNIFELVNGDLQLGYRTSAIQQRDLIVLSAKIKLQQGNFDEIKGLIDDYTFKRTSKQPLSWPSAGSTFKRPEGYYAGKLIEDSGLRGYQLGGAQVSDKHCGFIINKDNASARDIFNLIKHVQKTVFDKFGVTLEQEVRLLGDFN